MSMFSDIASIFEKGFHERIILLLLYLEKRSIVKFPLKIIRKLIIQCGYHCEIHPESFRDTDAIVSCSLPHPYMIIIHKNVSLGHNLRIFQGVTIGNIEKGAVAVPFIGDGVYIGAKASVLGGGKCRWACKDRSACFSFGRCLATPDRLWNL